MQTDRHISEIVASVTSRAVAIAYARAEANAIIEQLQRRADGWDQGAFRDDCRMVDRHPENKISECTYFSVSVAFALSRKFS